MRKPTSTPDVTVVIPTHNRRDSLLNVLEALGRQTLESHRFEAIVVCDGCTDETVSTCEWLSTPYRLRTIVQSQKSGPASARNRAVEDAAADLIVFIDDDVVPSPELLCEHLRIHEQDARAVGMGPLLAPAGFALNPWTRWEAAKLEQQYNDIDAGRWQAGPRQFYTGNASVRRSHLREAGGFDPKYRRAEDVELAFRLADLGLRFHFSSAAAGWHYAHRSLRSWLGIASAYGEADVSMYEGGRWWLLQNMAIEFHERRRPLRVLAGACVGRSIPLKSAVGLAMVVAQAAGWLGWERLAAVGYSVVFNLCYWDAIANRLGGREPLWKIIEAMKPFAIEKRQRINGTPLREAVRSAPVQMYDNPERQAGDGG